MTLQEMGTTVAMVATGIGVFRWMLKNHEDVCEQRWLASDDRHEENIQRFNAIARTLERQDDKLDRLLQKGAR